MGRVMKFQIRRTSHGFSQHRRPCEHDTLRDVTPTESRFGEEDEYEHIWTIEISTLEDLITLAVGPVLRRGDRNPRVIVGRPRDLEMPTLEIYDGYRE
jgi:hypothetical protein